MDGFVAGPESQLDWMTWEMDEKLIAFINHLTDTTDTILLGRKMTEGFMRRMGSRQGVCCGSSGRHRVACPPEGGRVYGGDPCGTAPRSSRSAARGMRT